MCVFCLSKLKNFLETREQEKVTGGLDRENMAGVLEHKPPVHSEMMSYFQSCDSRHCHVINTCLGYLSLVAVSERI